MVHTEDRRVPRRTIDHAINEIAARQHGLVTRSQLLDVGMTPDMIDGRIRTGRLVVVQRGVYATGPAPTQYAREMAAVLTCGGSAYLSHRSATLLWGMLRVSSNAPYDVIMRSRRCRPRTGVRVHTTLVLEANECTKLHGIPITTPARTLFDLAAVATLRELERAVAESTVLRITTESKVRAIAARYAGRTGSARLRAVLDMEHGPARTRSEAEDRLLDTVRSAQLREPQVNAMIEGFEVDFVWTRERLVVEVDGRAFHSSNRANERDHNRDAVLLSRGWRVMRLTWHQITNERDAVLVRLAQALALAPHG